MPVPEYPWWPDGATEANVRACNCDDCAALAGRLDAVRGEGPATEAGDAALQAFTDGGKP